MGTKDGRCRMMRERDGEEKDVALWDWRIKSLKNFMHFQTIASTVEIWCLLSLKIRVNSRAYLFAWSYLACACSEGNLWPQSTPMQVEFWRFAPSNGRFLLFTGTSYRNDLMISTIWNLAPRRILKSIFLIYWTISSVRGQMSSETLFVLSFAVPQKHIMDFWKSICSASRTLVVEEYLWVLGISRRCRSAKADFASSSRGQRGHW